MEQKLHEKHENNHWRLLKNQREKHKETYEQTKKKETLLYLADNGWPLTNFFAMNATSTTVTYSSVHFQNF